MMEGGAEGLYSYLKDLCQLYIVISLSTSIAYKSFHDCVLKKVIISNKNILDADLQSQQITQRFLYSILTDLGTNNVQLKFKPLFITFLKT